jgi:hypothetical protein
MTKQEQFIEQIAPIIVKVAKERGYKVASPVIAQACIESRYGESSLSAKYHNYFGLKCGSSWKGDRVRLKTKEEYTKGTLTTIYDNFRAYKDMEAGVNGYFDFISTKRYAALKECTTPEQYLKKIREAGYATSFTYVTTNMNVVKKYTLTGYDNFESVSDGNPYREPVSNIKKGMCGNAIKWIQYQLNLFGYKLIVDGIFGEKTHECVVDFQKNHLDTDGKPLVIDGIVGTKTKTALKEKS